jgi:hypothetical protein
MFFLKKNSNYCFSAKKIVLLSLEIKNENIYIKIYVRY